MNLTNENSENQKDILNPQISVDDLIIEIGKMHIEKIKNDKIINQLWNRVKEYENQIEFIKTSDNRRIVLLEEEVKKYKDLNTIQSESI